MKKRICLLLTTFIVILSCFSTKILLADENGIEDGIIFTYNSKTIHQTASQMEKYDKYGMNVDVSNQYNVVELIKNETSAVNDVSEITKKDSAIEKMLKNCKEMTAITYLDDNNVVIEYYADDGKEVCLWYGTDGLKQKLVYDSNNDSIYIEENSSAYVITHFREGYHFEISDTLLNKIYNLIDEGKLDEVRLIKGLRVITDSDGNIVIEPDYDMLMSNLIETMSLSSSSIPQNDTQLLNHLKSKFPMYTNRVKTNQQLMCSALNSSVAVKVTETRNAYAKVSADWRSFVAGTALTVIGYALDINIAGVQIILDALGVAYSASQTISETVRLSSSANYSYNATKRGCVYDKTVFNGYVLVVRHANKLGRFCGGYLNTGEFNWVHQSSSVYSISDSSVLNNALTNYNNDLLTNNNLCTYRPEYEQWSD